MEFDLQTDSWIFNCFVELFSNLRAPSVYFFAHFSSYFDSSNVKNALCSLGDNYSAACLTCNIKYFAKFFFSPCKIEQVSCVALSFFGGDQSETPSAGPPSGKASSGTARICDANAPKGKSVISATVW